MVAVARLVTVVSNVKRCFRYGATVKRGTKRAAQPIDALVTVAGLIWVLENMPTALIRFVSHFLSLSWLTGPIFDKELRVSSRRRRNYALRFAYIALLTIFLALVWLQEVRYGGSAVYRVSRMALTGQIIIMFIVWFQFGATQLLAIIMLSTSISDEIYNRTLGLLMTTPINSFQIVMGKLFSKLLQLILFLAISLPLLAIVRVFGGVPWDYVISSLCVTLTAVIFVGSVSLFFSIFSRRAYVVIILTILTYGVLFGLLPYLTGMGWHAITGHWPKARLTEAIFYPNPCGIMAFHTAGMMNPRGIGGPLGGLSWPPHCGIMLAASAVVLFMSVGMVRKVALRQAAGGLTSWRRRRARKNSSLESAVCEGSAVGLAIPDARRIRRINGSPTIWRELRTPLFGGNKIAASVVVFVSLLVLFVTYYLWHAENDLHREEVHMMYAAIFTGLGVLFTIILPATCITSEKESRSWPLLLATTLSDWQIIFGKFIGVLRRCYLIWLFLFGHLIIFILAGIIQPIALVQMAILVAWTVAFLCGTGLYFSSRLKHTTAAVIANFALAGVIWGVMPVLLFMVAEADYIDNDVAEIYMDTNPFVHAIAVMDGTVGRSHAGSSGWVGGNLDIFESTIWMLTCMVAYMLVGYVFVWRAKHRLRRNIF